MANQPWQIKIQEIEEEGSPWSGEADMKNKIIWLGTNAPKEKRAMILAHEIAHAKLETRETGRESERVLAEARADIYPYIKGWASRPIEEMVDDADEWGTYSAYRYAAGNLLRRKLITKQQYKEFLADLDEVVSKEDRHHFDWSKKGTKEMDEKHRRIVEGILEDRKNG